VSKKNGKERRIFDPFFSTGYVLQAAEGQGVGDQRQLDLNLRTLDENRSK
jgi:hypothetical protein